MTKAMMILFMLFASTSLWAYDQLDIDPAQQHCFAKAMVGMDSVINASLGVPAEHALDLVIPNGNFQVLNGGETVKMLNVILNAYFWKQSPHSYAVKVFFHCAQEQAIQARTVSREFSLTP